MTTEQTTNIVSLSGKNAQRFVVTMGVVAALGDFTYEGARSISTPYLGLLGASAAAIGMVAGLGEFVGYALRVVAGWWADRTRAHWLFLAIGYGLNLVAVPALALTERWELAAVLIVLERVGKALRSPSKSVLLAEVGPLLGEGKVFGFEEALDQVGAVAGPLLVLAVLSFSSGSDVTRARLAFAVLLVPVLVLLLFLRLAHRRFAEAHPPVLEQPQSPDGAPSEAAPPEAAPSEAAPSEAKLGRSVWLTLTAVSLIAFGFSDWAIVALHARDANLLSTTSLPLAYALLMGVDGVAALLFGVLFDRIGIRALALAALAPACAPWLLFEPALAPFVVGGVLWAIGLGALESISKAAIGKSVPRGQRGRAYGLFFGVFGLAWWAGSSIAGVLYGHSLVGLMAFSSAAPLAGALLLFGTSRRALQ